MIYKKVLIMVDLQNDFCNGGSLAVPDGDDVIPLANQLQTQFDLVIATQDWHPKDHMSFAINHPGRKVGEVVMLDNRAQVLWPSHCVQQSNGAEFHPALNTQQVNKIFHKGTDRSVDSYSAFFDNAHLRSTGLGDYLRAYQVEEVYLMGLATDYCVKYSALDAAALGFQVCVIRDACRGVELVPGDVAKAFTEMTAKGIKLLTVKEVMPG